MNRRFLKPLLCLAMAVLLTAAGFMQRSLNRDRLELGLNRYVELKGAPPVLALTTVALGGFRGLIANALWIRAMDLQDQDKYFEKVQLASWIVKLEPHYAHVWTVQAWDMAYNISVKFSDHADRWRWVKAGTELLRDEGLLYNPDSIPIYAELCRFFNHKMGANLDDAHMFYKMAWAREMNAVLGTNYVELLDPKTDEARAKAKELREHYKMDPAIMQEIDRKYGPLEWRLPESHAIYWAFIGLRKAKGEEIMMLRRHIYQSMQLAVIRGSFIEDKLTGGFNLGPNLGMSANANASYEEMMRLEADKSMVQNIATGHKNFLRRLPYYLYLFARIPEAGYWFDYLKQKYPDAVRPGMTLEDYVISRVTEVASETNRDQSKTAIDGLLTSAFIESATGDADRAINYERLAGAIWTRHQSEVGDDQKIRVGLPPYEQIKRKVLESLVGPDSQVRPELLAQLRAMYGGGPSTNAPAGNR
jgi:hypothetical protein